MKLHDLRPDPRSRKKRKRVGRGTAAGQGKTAGRGTKGQGARGRSSRKGPYFEGGQLPLVRRMPFKRGFTNIFRIEYQEVNVDQLQERFEAGDQVTPLSLAAARLVRKADRPVVILGRGDLDKMLTVSAHRFSGSARQKIETAGGQAIDLELPVTGARATVRKLRKADLARAAQADTEA